MSDIKSLNYYKEENLTNRQRKNMVGWPGEKLPAGKNHVRTKEQILRQREWAEQATPFSSIQGEKNIPPYRRGTCQACGIAFDARWKKSEIVATVCAMCT